MSTLITYKSIAKKLNDRVINDYYYRLMLLARSIFEWENLPNGINEKWIEKYLFSHGECVFYKDDTLGFMVSKITENSPMNHYDEPTTVRPYATGYTISKDLTPDENCIIIRNNDESRPTSETIQLYAYKLANLDRTIDVNVIAQKTPIIIKCTEAQKTTLKNLFKQRDDNEPLIWGDNDLDLSGVEVLKTDAPIVFDKLELQKHMVLNEVYTFLGVNNANQDKRERLVDDEVQANNEQVEASFNIMLKAREDACKRINDLFGTNIKVKKRIKIDTSILDSEPSETPSEPSETIGGVE